MARQARCNRVHSAVTYRVNVIEVGKVNVHAVFLKFASGQLPFLGLSLIHSDKFSLMSEVLITFENLAMSDFISSLNCAAGV